MANQRITGNMPWGKVFSVDSRQGAVDLSDRYVGLTGNQSVAGEKTFSDKIIAGELDISGDTIANNQADGDIQLIPAGSGGIGDGSALDGARFRLKKTGATAIDQQFTVAGQQTIQTSFWQSITAGVDGFLTKTEIFRSNLPSESAGTVAGSVDIRVGEGLGGVVAASTTFDTDAFGTWLEFDFAKPAFFKAGDQYTMVINVTGGTGQLYHRYNNAGGYDGGRYSISSNWDLLFRAYMLTGAVDFAVKADTGYVGIGVPDPTERLHIAGNILISGTYFVGMIKSGATQAAAGAVAGEPWRTSGHAILPDNVQMVGV